MIKNTHNKPFKPLKITKNSFERTAWSRSAFICGIDEVGRGCLAGPLVAAAAILKKPRISSKLKDSKLLTPDQLIDSFNWASEACWYGIGIVNNTSIDSINIYQATLLAMNKAVTNLLAHSPHIPEAILIDAMPLKLTHSAYAHIPIHSFTKGESLSASIAAASIIAKVTRDRLMKKIDTVFPGYKLDEHKGYGTKKHQAQLNLLGHSLIHRVSFLHSHESKDNENQQTIC